MLERALRNVIARHNLGRAELLLLLKCPQICAAFPLYAKPTTFPSCLDF